MRIIVVLIVATLLSPAILFSQNPSSQNDIFVHVDKNAELPGGEKSLHDYVSRNMVYPKEARKNGIEGKVCVEFVIGTGGYVEPASVKIAISLHPLCDDEAVRVIKACPLKWNPALKSQKPVSQKFILPIDFSTGSNSSRPSTPVHAINNPIKAVVTDHNFETREPIYTAVFDDVTLTNVSGQIRLGETVEVIGWSAWSYLVRTEKASGYVSWRALADNHELNKLSALISARSEHEEERQVKAVNGVSKALLQFEGNKRSVYVGECLTLSLSFNASINNNVKFKLMDIEQQLAAIIQNDLTPDSCRIAAEQVATLIGTPKKIVTFNYTSYPLYSAAYCPMKPGKITMDTTQLKMLGFKKDGSFDTLVFSSRPFSVTVHPLPNIATKNSLPPVGKFRMRDVIQSKEISVGQTVMYKVTITGDGLASLINPFQIEIENVVSELRNSTHNDVVIKGALRSTKTFTYALTFKKAGEYDFNGKLAFVYFDPEDEQLITLNSNSVITVKD